MGGKKTKAREAGKTSKESPHYRFNYGPYQSGLKVQSTAPQQPQPEKSPEDDVEGESPKPVESTSTAPENQMENDGISQDRSAKIVKDDNGDLDKLSDNDSRKPPNGERAESTSDEAEWHVVDGEHAKSTSNEGEWHIVHESEYL
ncbi:MAG: hypothetical protein Q9183_001378 [Haloplaca sp. 2 TL-2023]